MISKTNWPLQHKGERNRSELTAVVKGAGPGALAATATLAQEGYKVVAAGIRSENVDGGRQNVVVLRPEAMRQLDLLGAVSLLERAGKISRNHDFRVINEMTGMDLRPPQVDFRAPDYTPPKDRKDHFTTHMVCLGDLEDVLEQIARDYGADIRHEASISLHPASNTKRFHATLPPNDGHESAVDLGFPDLVVGASGKNDAALDEQLGIIIRRGVKVDVANLPLPGTPNLRLGHDNELEKQKFIVFGLRNPALENGTFLIRVRKVGAGAATQPVCEFKFGHKGVTTLLLQLPRELDTSVKSVEAYALERANHYLGTKHSNLTALQEKLPLAWGAPGRAFDVQTQTALTFTYGTNVVLLGDRGATCSPSSGIGAEIAATLDPLNIRQLAIDIKQRSFAKAAQQLGSTKPRKQALAEYNARKAESVELWSRSSRPFYLTSIAAQAVVDAATAR